MRRSQFLLGFAWLVVACASSDAGNKSAGQQSCTAGTAVACPCPDGSQATAACGPDGHYGICQCPGAGGGAPPFGGSAGESQAGAGNGGFPQGGFGNSGFGNGGVPQGGVGNGGLPQGGAGGVPQGGVGGLGDSGAQGGAAGTGGSQAAGCTGKPGAHKGKSSQSVMAGGANRTYIVYEPQNLDPNKAVPLLYVFHGASMSGSIMFDITEFSKIADREGFVAVFPDGEGGPGTLAPWNVGTNVCGTGALVSATGDDNAFIDAMKAFVEADQCIDEKHIFATGFSMGGYFSHHIGCTRPDFRAVGPHSGGTHPFTSCTTGHVPVIIFHGTADALISPSCDDTSRQQWVQKNGCGTGIDDTGGPILGPLLTKPAPNNAICEFSQGCPADGQVVFCKFQGMAHAWAGGPANYQGGFFNNSAYDSATDLAWTFFKNYAW